MVCKFFKKFKTQAIMILLSLFIMPTSILAYSEYLIPGGENIGIELKNKGITIVGLYEVDGAYPGRDANLKVGDTLVKVGDKSVSNIDELVSELNKASTTAKLTYLRNDKEMQTNLSLTKDSNGVSKTGLYVKDSITGLGTLSFIDPETKIFGALGHEIMEKATGKILEIKDGKIFNSEVTDILRSENGVPGEKNAKFYSDQVTGKVTENTSRGIFGAYTDTLPNKKQYKVAKPDEIKAGEAKLLTVLNGSEVKEYSIEITKINHNMSQKTKNILFSITDEALLKETGGIVQGMSGSPIIQNGKIIAAVTHVVVNEPTKGYGIFITNMLEEAEN